MNQSSVVATVKAAGEVDEASTFIGFRLPNGIAERLRTAAAREDRSVSSWLRLTIQKALSSEADAGCTS